MDVQVCDNGQARGVRSPGLLLDVVGSWLPTFRDDFQPNIHGQSSPRRIPGTGGRVIIKGRYGR